MKYVAIDIETTGLSYDSQVLEVAMVKEDTDQDVGINALPTASFLFRHDQIIGTPYALDMHTKSGLLDEAQEYGNNPQEVWKLIASWLGAPEVGRKHIAAGKNAAGFDLQFFPKEVKEMFHHRVIDPGSVLINWDQSCISSLGELKKEFGLSEAVSHRALDDALDVVRVLRKTYTTHSGGWCL